VDGWVRMKRCTAGVPKPVPQPKLSELVLINPVRVLQGPNDRSLEMGFLSAGMRVKILEQVGDFAHIVSPQDGFINMNEASAVVAPSQPVVSPLVQPTPTVLSTIQCLVTEGMSARDLALSCERSSGSLPKKVRIQLINNRRIGVVGYESRSAAEVILSRGLVHLGQQILVKWYPRELAI